jgi:adenylate cyclase
VARPLDLVSVKGKKQAFLAYELLGVRGAVAADVEEMVHSYAAALDRYRARDWDEAIRYFGDVLRLRPDDVPSRNMISRCRCYKDKAPPVEWDAINRLSEK